MKRKTRRNFRKVILGIILAFALLAGLLLLAAFVKNTLPLLKLSSEQKSTIIKPVLESATRENLQKLLSDNNLIMESLAESSFSAVIVGEIRDGPKVYFAKDKEAKSQVSLLLSILNKLAINNKKPIIIDLRFQQPIVKF